MYYMATEHNVDRFILDQSLKLSQTNNRKLKTFQTLLSKYWTTDTSFEHSLRQLQTERRFKLTDSSVRTQKRGSFPE